MLTAQKDAEMNDLRRELERTRKRHQEEETVSLQRLEELQDRFEAECDSFAS